MRDTIFISSNGARGIGVDVGNYDTKTQSTNTSSSYKRTEIEPLMASELLYFENYFYEPSIERNKQLEDKRQDDYMFHMTLFGIAKEILSEVTNPNMSFDAMQDAVSNVKTIKLGVGLPVGHFSKLANKYAEYYNDKTKNGISFAYKESRLTNGKKIFFNLKIDDTIVLPQDVIAVIYNDTLTIPNNFSDYDIIGIGGGTVDICSVRDGKPQTQNCITKMKGTTFLYQRIADELQQNGMTVRDFHIIEKVIRNERTILSADEIKFINKCVEKFTNEVVEELIHAGLQFSSYPTVFIGGGALLMKPYLEKHGAFVKTEFVKSVNENAICYAQATVA